MEKLTKIILNKYFPSAEHIKPDLLTKEEYQIVKNCRLHDLLQVETNPFALDRICEGEKRQTVEFYQQKEKSYKRNVMKLYRKTGKDSAETRSVPPVVSSLDKLPDTHIHQATANDDQATTTRDNQPSVQLIASEEVLEPARSNEAFAPQHDPYLLREEITPIPIVMPFAVLPEDENFGSNDVDGARDFLQMCTGEELPPMSMRQTMTRDMLLSQLPSIPAAPPLVDNFQELDLKSINTPMFKRPLGTSTPFVQGAVQEAQNPLPALQARVVGQSEDPIVDGPPIAAFETVPFSIQTVPTTDKPGPSAEISEPAANSRVLNRPLVAESSSSSDLSEEPAPRSRGVRRQVSYTERLEPIRTLLTKPRPRRNDDIFSYPCQTFWNKMIQDVQNQLHEMYKQLQSREETVMREAAQEQKVDSGFQQTPYELSHRPAAMSLTDTSNFNQLNGKEPSVQTIQQDTLMTTDMVTSMQPNELGAFDSIEGKLTEVSNRFELKRFTDPTSISNDKTASNREQPAPVEHVSVLKETSKNNIVQQPIVEVDSRLLQTSKRGKRNKKMESVQKENYPSPDISYVLFNQAKELETVTEQGETVGDEMLPIDAMLIDILLTVQGATMEDNAEQLEQTISVQRLQQLLRINSRLDASKLFKNILLLKQTYLLDTECNSQHRITNVKLMLPQVSDVV